MKLQVLSIQEENSLLNKYSFYPLVSKLELRPAASSAQATLLAQEPIIHSCHTKAFEYQAILRLNVLMQKYKCLQKLSQSKLDAVNPDTWILIRPFWEHYTLRLLLSLLFCDKQPNFESIGLLDRKFFMYL